MIDTVELDDRITKCEKILSSDSNSQIFAALADAYRKKGDISKAREICQAGLKIHPNYASARVVMAKIHLFNEDYVAAKDELNKAIESSGRSRAIDILEAEIFVRIGNTGEAKIILKRLFESDPQDDIVRNLLSMIGEKAPQVSGKAGGGAGTDHSGNQRRVYKLSEIVGILKVMPRVMGVVAVSENGLVLEGRFDGLFSKDEVGALAKNIYDLSYAGGHKINIGKTNEILIETQSSKLWIFKREEFLLVIFARDDVSMGSLKLKIENMLSRINTAVEAG